MEILRNVFDLWNFQEAVGQLRNLDKIEDKEIRQNKQPNEELQL